MEEKIINFLKKMLSIMLLLIFISCKSNDNVSEITQCNSKQENSKYTDGDVTLDQGNFSTEENSRLQEQIQDSLKSNIQENLDFDEYPDAVTESDVNYLKDLRMVDIPGKDIEMLSTEVTQALYTSVMGENPSYNKGDNNPVECVSWYDAIYFCNLLSKKYGLTPVYSADGKTDVTEWDYTPHNMDSIQHNIREDRSADGFRLPWWDEWYYASMGGENYEYAGSDNLDEVGWYDENSGGKTHPVAQKKANGFGLYDMSGNVREWAANTFFYQDINYNTHSRFCDGAYLCGGGYYSWDIVCEARWDSEEIFYQDDDIGFRIVCSPSSK